MKDRLNLVCYGRVVLNSYSVKTLTLNIIFQRNDLVYLRPYSERQVKLHRIIKKLREYRHMSLKSIADKLNAFGIKTHRGSTFSSGSIHSILKRKKERERIKQKNKTHYFWQTQKVF